MDPRLPPRTSLARCLQLAFSCAVFMYGTHFVLKLLAWRSYAAYPSNYGLANDLSGLPDFYSSVVFAPVFEELLMRGVLLGALLRYIVRVTYSRRAAVWIAVSVVSVVFTVLHETASPVLMTGRAVGSVALALMFLSEGLLGSILAHAFYNGSLFALAALATLPAGLGGPLILGVLLASLRLCLRWFLRWRASTNTASPRFGALAACICASLLLPAVAAGGVRCACAALACAALGVYAAWDRLRRAGLRLPAGGVAAAGPDAGAAGGCGCRVSLACPVPEVRICPGHARQRERAELLAAL